MLAKVETARRARILIVDDLAANRILLTRLFSQKGFDCVEAETGVHALELIRGETFDTVLLDVMMPDMSGFDVLSLIRADFLPETLPVIMVTALTASEDVVRALKLGANDYLTKPVDLPVALARVSAQVARKRAEDAVEELVCRLETAIHAHLGQLNRETETLARTALEPAQCEAVEALRLSGSDFMKTVGEAMRAARTPAHV